MSTMTFSTDRSKVQLELALRAALLHDPQEYGRERARRATSRLTATLAAAAGGIIVFDLLLVLTR